MPSNTPFNFTVGQNVAGVDILDIGYGRTISANRYAARYTCCGREQVLTHGTLRSRASRGATACPECVKRHLIGVGASRPLAASVLPHPERTRTDASGQPWPFLGKLGPRWAGGDTIRRSEARNG